MFMKEDIMFSNFYFKHPHTDTHTHTYIYICISKRKKKEKPKRKSLKYCNTTSYFFLYEFGTFNVVLLF